MTERMRSKNKFPRKILLKLFWNIIEYLLKSLSVEAAKSA